MKRLRPRRALTAMLANLTVLTGTAGCAGLLSSAPPAQVYVLRAAPTAVHEGTSAVRSSLRVERPQVGPGLSSDHIMLVQSDHRMSYFLGSRWAAPLPEVLESLAVETLRAAGGWAVVQDSTSAFTAEYLLQITIRRFEADYTQNSSRPEIHVVLECTLGRRVDREVITSFEASGSATAAANRLSEVVAAFEAAAQMALSTVAVRTAQAVAPPAPTGSGTPAASAAPAGHGAPVASNLRRPAGQLVRVMYQLSEGRRAALLTY